jgi:hypothetical protein
MFAVDHFLFEPIISAVRHPYSKYIKYVMILSYFYCDLSGAGTSDPSGAPEYTLFFVGFA